MALRVALVESALACTELASPHASVFNGSRIVTANTTFPVPFPHHNTIPTITNMRERKKKKWLTKAILDHAAKYAERQNQLLTMATNFL